MTTAPVAAGFGVLFLLVLAVGVSENAEGVIVTLAALAVASGLFALLNPDAWATFTATIAEIWAGMTDPGVAVGSGAPPHP